MHSVELLQVLLHASSNGVHTDTSTSMANKNSLSEFVLDGRALWIALGVIAMKEGLFRWTYRIGKRLDSSVLMANAWHHRAGIFVHTAFCIL